MGGIFDSHDNLSLDQYEKIYFWDHEQESETPDDMSNMYFLANDIDEFLDNLYEDTEERI